MLLISGNVILVKALLFIALATAGFSACSKSTADDGTLNVAVSFYPIEETVRRVGGSDIDVTALVPAGSEPHDFEPTARQVAALEDADIVFYLGGDFQPSLQRAIESLPGSVRRVDLLDALRAQGHVTDDDPHVWLDPENMRAMTQAVVIALGEAVAQLAPRFTNSSVTYIDELIELDDEFATGLAQCAVPVLITTHNAFGYLASAYGLTQIPIAGISPGDEPSAQQLEQIAERAIAAGVTTIFFEENLPNDLARTLADEVGVQTAALSTVETLTEAQLGDGESYLTLMRANLQALRAGMGCT